MPAPQKLPSGSVRGLLVWSHGEGDRCERETAFEGIAAQLRARTLVASSVRLVHRFRNLSTVALLVRV